MRGSLRRVVVVLALAVGLAGGALGSAERSSPGRARPASDADGVVTAATLGLDWAVVVGRAGTADIANGYGRPFWLLAVPGTASAALMAAFSQCRRRRSRRRAGNQISGRGHAARAPPPLLSY